MQHQDKAPQTHDSSQHSQFFPNGIESLKVNGSGSRKMEHTARTNFEAAKRSDGQTARAFDGDFLKDYPQLQSISNHLQANWKVLLSEVIVAGVGSYLAYRAKRII